MSNNDAIQKDLTHLIEWAKEHPYIPDKKTKDSSKNDKEKSPCVYFISDGTYVKIGATTDVESRLKALQVGNPRELRILSVIPTDDPYALEAILHNRFADKQVNQEWYDLKKEFTKTSVKYLKPKEIEEILGLSHATVHKLINTPGFPAIRIGKAVRIPDADFYEYMYIHNTCEELRS